MADMPRWTCRRPLRHVGHVEASIDYLADRLESYMEMGIAGRERLQAALAVVFVTGHVGNWELMARLVAKVGAPVSAIAKRGGDAPGHEADRDCGIDGAVTTLWREDASTGRALLRVFKENKVLGLLVDQDTSVRGVQVPSSAAPAFSARGPAWHECTPILVGPATEGERPGTACASRSSRSRTSPGRPEEAEVLRRSPPPARRRSRTPSGATRRLGLDARARKSCGEIGRTLCPSPWHEKECYGSRHLGANEASGSDLRNPFPGSGLSARPPRARRARWPRN